MPGAAHAPHPADQRRSALPATLIIAGAPSRSARSRSPSRAECSAASGARRARPRRVVGVAPRRPARRRIPGDQLRARAARERVGGGLARRRAPAGGRCPRRRGRRSSRAIRTAARRSVLQIDAPRLRSPAFASATAADRVRDRGHDEHRARRRAAPARMAGASRRTPAREIADGAAAAARPPQCSVAPSATASSIAAASAAARARRRAAPSCVAGEQRIAEPRASLRRARELLDELARRAPARRRRA